MNTLSSLNELKKYVKDEIWNYHVEQLTRKSTIEFFYTNKKYFALLRCNATAIMVACTDGFNNLISVRRLCEIHNIDGRNAKAIQKFCLRMRYKTYVNNNNKLCPPKWSYIKEELLNYTILSSLEWAIYEM